MWNTITGQFQIEDWTPLMSLTDSLDKVRPTIPFATELYIPLNMSWYDHPKGHLIYLILKLNPLREIKL